jgi:general secretion pathway protein G
MKKILKKGFTLIELLVVIAIIAILISVGSVSYTRSLKLSRDSRRKTDLEQLRQALETYRSETGTYPTSATFSTDLVPNYITSIPADPKSYLYPYNRLTATTYTLCASLEVTPASGSTASCGSCGTTACNYRVVQP